MFSLKTLCPKNRLRTESSQDQLLTNCLVTFLKSAVPVSFSRKWSQMDTAFLVFMI